MGASTNGVGALYPFLADREPASRSANKSLKSAPARSDDRYFCIQKCESIAKICSRSIGRSLFLHPQVQIDR
ncbi:hypothetical protein [Microcoleus sp. CAWBG58]|uniref:hypothetical protein n=1 Tax=Microcoleus sp. CAWBG58 TaxID=2841651 RepID=UPI0025F97D40|nr:hypothetical protein [Microcoleus sp. CAWBG58]